MLYSHKGMQTVSLRPSYVWSEDRDNQLIQMVNDPGVWAKNLWAYVHTEDMARAIDLALTTEFVKSFEVFVINARDNGTRVDARELKREFYPDTPVKGPELHGTDSFINITKARELMGWVPKHSWRDLE